VRGLWDTGPWYHIGAEARWPEMFLLPSPWVTRHAGMRGKGCDIMWIRLESWRWYMVLCVLYVDWYIALAWRLKLASRISSLPCLCPWVHPSSYGQRCWIPALVMRPPWYGIATEALLALWRIGSSACSVHGSPWRMAQSLEWTTCFRSAWPFFYCSRSLRLMVASLVAFARGGYRGTQIITLSHSWFNALVWRCRREYLLPLLSSCPWCLCWCCRTTGSWIRRTLYICSYAARTFLISEAIPLNFIDKTSQSVLLVGNLWGHLLDLDDGSRALNWDLMLGWGTQKRERVTFVVVRSQLSHSIASVVKPYKKDYVWTRRFAILIFD